MYVCMCVCVCVCKKCVLLTGGNTLYPHFAERVYAELMAILPEHTPIRNDNYYYY